MSLNWKVNTDLVEWNKLCDVTKETLIFATMAVDMGQITEDNWTEFYARININERLFGTLRSSREKGEHFFTPDEIKCAIGLETNATFDSAGKTRQKFINNQWRRFLAERKDFAEKVIEEKEKEDESRVDDEGRE